jgi:hypothetical protein
MKSDGGIYREKLIRSLITILISSLYTVVTRHHIMRTFRNIIGKISKISMENSTAMFSMKPSGRVWR